MNGHPLRAHITEVLSPVGGIERIGVDIAAKQVCVTYDPSRSDIERMQAILAEEDYPTTRVG